ncbi:hypothetical protein UPYG_G00108520 [Umbra pygmaea]|uniref:Synaptogyrin n=1 Tax=Umbra pygmaea TaxID=75934 RepID=A0ABD0XS20_UMBPY
MESSAYGASLAGGDFDLIRFIMKPQTIVRFLCWLFSIIVFATITGEGYVNESSGTETHCIFNKNDSACSFGVGIGILAFLACVIFIVLDAFFPNISNANERKYIVIGDLGFSGVWTFFWFISFCLIANQWSKTTEEVAIVNTGDAARAVVTFSFFSIVTWALLTIFAYMRYREGVNEFDQGYTDPANDHNTPYPASSAYPPYPNTGPQGYQQSPFTPQNQEPPGPYQPPSY